MTRLSTTPTTSTSPNWQDTVREEAGLSQDLSPDQGQDLAGGARLPILEDLTQGVSPGQGVAVHALVAGAEDDLGQEVDLGLEVDPGVGVDQGVNLEVKERVGLGKDTLHTRDLTLPNAQMLRIRENPLENHQ